MATAATGVDRRMSIEFGLTWDYRCPFARKWLQDHPEAAAEVKVDWTPMEVF